MLNSRNNVQAWTFQRAGSIDLNPTTFAQRSAAFASSATTWFNSVTLIVTRDEEGVHGYLVSGPWKGMDAASMSLAHAVGAKAVRLDEPATLLGPGREVVGRLDYVSGDSGGLIQAGADPTEVIKTLVTAMPIGSWVGAVLRRPSCAPSPDVNTQLPADLTTDPVIRRPMCDEPSERQ